jgi:hypothetical protein
MPLAILSAVVAGERQGAKGHKATDSRRRSATKPLWHLRELRLCLALGNDRRRRGCLPLTFSLAQLRNGNARRSLLFRDLDNGHCQQH